MVAGDGVERVGQANPGSAEQLPGLNVGPLVSAQNWDERRERSIGRGGMWQALLSHKVASSSVLRSLSGPAKAEFLWFPFGKAVF